jgi:hypothetical protein
LSSSIHTGQPVVTMLHAPAPQLNSASGRLGDVTSAAKARQTPRNAAQGMAKALLSFLSMIPKSGNRFSVKVMRKQKSMIPKSLSST